MTLDEVMSRLQELGTEQTRKTYARHGSGPNCFGVKNGDLQKLQKQIRKDHDLAQPLWKTGNADAQTLALLIADPEKATPEELTAWAAGITSYYVLADYLSAFVVRTPLGAKLALEWIDSPHEFTAAAGWNTVARLAVPASTAMADREFERLLDRIEQRIHSAKNRERYSMNGALIGIGTRNARLQQLATAAAERVGRVEVDHGDTGCKTPDAVAYIRKTVEHRAKKKG